MTRLTPSEGKRAVARSVRTSALYDERHKYPVGYWCSGKSGLSPNKLISRNGDIHWPPRSPDLSSCDYFLWGYLKSKVFATRPDTIQELKERIRTEIRAITPLVLRRVSENLQNRLTQCVQNNGRHLPGIIFRT